MYISNINVYHVSSIFMSEWHMHHFRVQISYKWRATKTAYGYRGFCKPKTQFFSSLYPNLTINFIFPVFQFIHCISRYYFTETRQKGWVSCSMRETWHIRSYWTQRDTNGGYISFNYNWDNSVCHVKWNSRNIETKLHLTQNF